MVTYEDIKSNKEILSYVDAADRSLFALGYTEHGKAHVGAVAEGAAELLLALGYSEREAELARIAGYLHDIGNVVNRIDHSQSGAVMAFRLLDKAGMPAAEIAEVVTAIGNHDEGSGTPVSPISAALIIADKTDVRRSRVRNGSIVGFDIHDRVNYSVTKRELKLDAETKTLTLALTIDTEISPITEYFEIFLERMLLCRRAAETLGASFKLEINGQKLM